MIEGFDCREMRRLLRRLDNADVEQACRRILLEAGQEYFEDVKNNTVSGKYSSNVHGYEKTGGTLRRSWTTTGVQRTADGLQLKIINPEKYGIYVEEGHRQNVGQFVPAIGKRLVQPAVQGKHFVRDSCKQSRRKVMPIARDVVGRLLRG